MSTYIIGDIHGYYEKLCKVLNKISFNPNKDTIWLTGDLVSRGPQSLNVLRLIKKNKNIKMVLGNHDLNLLAIYYGIKKNKQEFNISEILNAKDSEEIILWLRNQPMLQINEKEKLIMTHAGIHPQWNLDHIYKYSQKIENLLKSDNYSMVLNAINNDGASKWNIEYNNETHLQFCINVFTRMRYCFTNGNLDFQHKNHPNKTPKTLIPWFNVPRLIPDNYNIVFGHWSSLNCKGTPPRIYGIDSGCGWGGKLTLMKWENKQFIFS